MIRSSPAGRAARAGGRSCKPGGDLRVPADDVPLQGDDRGRLLDDHRVRQLRQPLVPAERRDNSNVYDAEFAREQVGAFEYDRQRLRRITLEEWTNYP